MKILVIVAQDFVAMDRQGTWNIHVRHSAVVPQLLQNKKIAWVHNRNAVHWECLDNSTQRKYGSLEDLYRDIDTYERGKHLGMNRTGRCDEPNIADICILVSATESTLVWNALMACLSHDHRNQKNILESLRTSGGIDITWEEMRAAA